MNLVSMILFILLVITTGTILGVLTFCQCVHYPLYKKIKDGFTSYEQEFQRMMVFFMTPLIILDVFFNLILAIQFGGQDQGIYLALSLTFNIITWLVTFFFQVEYHKKLLAGFSSKNIKATINANRVALVLWIAKTACLCAYVLLIHKSMY